MISGTILTFYGIFLITCGIVSVTFIGLKAKTALISGGMSCLLSLGVAYFVFSGNSSAQVAAMVLPLFLLGIFSWRCSKTLFSLIEKIKRNDEDVNKKAIAFLIISLMAVVSLVVLASQVVIFVNR